MSDKALISRSPKNIAIRSIKSLVGRGNSNVVQPNALWEKASLFIEIAFITGLIAYAVGLLAKGLVTPWYSSSDEVVYAAEVIKFLDLNFNQNFFDIPGTPFMFLTTILWAGWYGLLHIAGQVDPAVGIKLFTFQHLQDLYFLMRLLVLVFYASSIVLTYVCGKRLTNAIGGCIAALFLAFFFPYAAYSSFIRTESMGITLALTALYLTLDAIAFGKIKYFFIAGILSGVATAARFHFALATLPIIIPLYFLTRKQTDNHSRKDTNSLIADEPIYSITSDENIEARPRWLAILLSLIGSLFFVGGLITVLLSLNIIQPSFLTHAMLVTADTKSIGDLTKGLTLMRKLWLLLAILSLAFFIAFRTPKLRDRAQSLLSPAIVLILTGFGVGLVLGTPTFLWRGSYLLRSVQFYGNWIDYDRQKLSFPAQLIDVYSSYWKVITPTTGIACLLIAGGILILIRRDRYLYPILFGAILAFVSQPILLPTASYRVAPWLPYLAIVQAYPLAVAYQAITRFNQRYLILQLLSFGTIILIGFSVVHDGVKHQSNNIEQIGQSKIEAIENTTDWLEKNTGSDEQIFLSYFSFNKAIFYSWMEQQGASVPSKLKGTRKYHIWWGDRTTLQKQLGYMVITQADLAVKADWDKKKSGEGVDPFAEKEFIKVASFAGGGFQFSIFRFDFKQATKGN